MAGGVLQLQEHRVYAQHGVLGAPRLRARRASSQYSNGRASQRGQARIRAVGVCIEHCPARRIEARHARCGHVAKSMPPQLTIGGKERGSQQRGELAGRRAAQQIHLEEPILGVHIAERECEIVAVLRRDGSARRPHRAHANVCMDAATRCAAVERAAGSRAVRATRRESRREVRPRKDDREDDDAPGTLARSAVAQTLVSCVCPTEDGSGRYARASMRAAFPNGTP